MTDVAIAEKIKLDAAKALMCSLLGLFCCGLAGIAGFVWGLQTLETAKLHDSPEGVMRSKAAIVLGSLAIALWVVGFVVKLLTAR